MLIPLVHGGVSVISDLTLDITSNASEQNILTLAQAAGYNAATDDTAIVVNIASGVTISGSTTHALRTGALNANSDLTINVASGAAITGFTGANGGTGAAGSAGGDGIFFEISSGTGTYLVDNDGTISGGGGGGGGGGTAGSRQYLYNDGKSTTCVGWATSAGSAGSGGSAGGLGQAGSAGSAGSLPAGSCPVVTNPGSGGAGGAAGKAVNYGGLTVSTTGSAGTFNGATS